MAEDKLDKRDKELLSLLYKDSRMSFTEIGKHLQLSPTTVDRRIVQHKNAGTISLLFADVNFAKLGFKSYRIYLKFDSFEPDTERHVLEFFEFYPRTLWGCVCEGAYDVLWRIIAKDEAEVEEALSLFIERFGNKIQEKTVITTTFQTYLSWNRAFGGERYHELPMEKAAPLEKVDDTDMKIIAALYGNARETTVDIAKLTNLTPDAINYRIKHLNEAGILMGYSAWFNPRNLGFEYYKIFFNFRSITKEKEKRFFNLCIQSNNVVHINNCIGSWDMEVDIIVENTLELHKFMSDIKSKSGQILGSYSYVAIIDDRMLNPLKEYLHKRNEEK